MMSDSGSESDSESDSDSDSDSDGRNDNEDGKRLVVAKVRHPILRLEVLHPNGSRSTEHRVFCRYQKKSVQVGTCCACLHCDSIESAPDKGASVNCTITVDAADAEPDPLGVRTEVAAVLSRGTLVLDPSSTLKQAFDLLRAEDRRSLPVVDANTSIVGVIHETAFLPKHNRSEHPEEAVAHAMSSSLAIHETVPIRRALEMLAAAHLREATVVDSDGVPLGVFHDIDGLRWIYASRTTAL
jgi:CBS domain-containing protein